MEFVKVTKDLLELKDGFDPVELIERLKVVVSPVIKKAGRSGWVVNTVSLVFMGTMPISKIQISGEEINAFVFQDKDYAPSLLISHPGLIRVWKFVEDSVDDQYRAIMTRENPEYSGTLSKKCEPSVSPSGDARNGIICTKMSMFGNIVTTPIIDIDEVRLKNRDCVVKTSTPMNDDDYRGFLRDVRNENAAKEKACKGRSYRSIDPLRPIYFGNLAANVIGSYDDITTKMMPIEKMNACEEMKKWKIIKAKFSIYGVSYEISGNGKSPTISSYAQSIGVVRKSVDGVASEIEAAFASMDDESE